MLQKAALGTVAKRGGAAQQRPKPDDPVGKWLPPATASMLQAAGLETLHHVRRQIAASGRWFDCLPNYGPVRAGALAKKIAHLLGDSHAAHKLPDVVSLLEKHRGIGSPHLASPHNFKDDKEAVDFWLKLTFSRQSDAHVASIDIARFAAWCAVERRKPISRIQPRDCKAYKRFLAKIPKKWIHAGKLLPGQPSWAPFNRQPSAESQLRALATLKKLFLWLADVQYVEVCAFVW